AAAPPAAPSPAPALQATTSIRAIQVGLRISNRCWIQAVADGRTVFRGTLMPGQSKLLRARRALALTLGNAGGANVILGGKHIPTGGAGQVIHVTITLQRGRLHVTRV